MREVTQEMIEQFKIKKLKYDFMGYIFNTARDLSFHHTIIPKRDCKQLGLGEGYLYWNGSILVQDTAHEYLHVIERIDRLKFLAITDSLIKQNRLGELSLQELKLIREILLEFENEHKNDVNKQGKKLIKQEYVQKRIIL